MTPEKQIIAIAELGGWKQKPTSIGYWGESDNGMYPPDLHPMANLNVSFKFPDYLTSRDAIIPVIEKQTEGIYIKVVEHLYVRFFGIWPSSNSSIHILNVARVVLFATSPQLSEALLRATGKWEE